jgi:SAM-dependent methyltransferase
VSGALSAEERAQRLARYYDLDLLDVVYDAELYQQLAHAVEGPVLELGVGSGRVGIPLALAGHEVLGIDSDPAMLARAEAAWEAQRGALERERLRTVVGDFRRLRTELRFGLALIAVNTFLLAEDDEARLAILTTMREHLRPGGVAAVEIGTPDRAELERYDRRIQHEWLRDDPETGEQVSKSISANYDAGENTLELTQIYEWTAATGGSVSRVTQVDLLHLVSAAHLEQLAQQAGFGEVSVWGDHLLTPYGAGSHRAILQARLV